MVSMLKKASFLIVGLALVALAPGCNQGTTAPEIISNCGILHNDSIARIIESGEADKMIKRGHAHKTYEVRWIPWTFGSKKVLVTKYKINGEIYMVEVRRSFNPLAGSPANPLNIEYILYQQHGDLTPNIITATRNLATYNALVNHSYEARCVRAYRAYRGTDGKIRQARVEDGETPAWVSQSGSNDCVTLNFRTVCNGVPIFTLKGLTSDGRQDLSTPYGIGDVVSTIAGAGVLVDSYDKKMSNTRTTHDYRWVVTGTGSVLDRVQPFYNRKLLRAVLGCQPEPNTDFFAKPTSAK